MDKIIDSYSTTKYIVTEYDNFCFTVRNHGRDQKEFISENRSFTIGMIIHILKNYSSYKVDWKNFTIQSGCNLKGVDIADGIKKFSIDYSEQSIILF